MESYLLIYLSSAVLSLLITPVTIWLAKRFNVVDIPDARKVHSRAIPRVGGVALFIPLVSITLSTVFCDNIFREELIKSCGEILVLLSLVTFIFLVGLADDIRGLGSKIKLLLEAGASVAVCAAGFRIESITFSEGFVINFGIFSWPITIIWIVGITNAVNLIDGLDGLAAGLSAVACGVMVILSIYFEQLAMTIIMLSLLGSLTGFLFFNFNPAKIFMGDCGSLLLGFTIASSSVIFAAKSQAIVSLTLPILALGIPIFDTLLSMMRRFIERRSMFSPDFEHFHHKLLALGLRQRHIVIIAYTVTLLASGFGMFMIFSRSVESIIIFASIVILLLLCFRTMGVFKIEEVITKIRDKYNMTGIISEEKRGFESARLEFFRAKTFEQWWQSLCRAAEKMHFERINLAVTKRDGTKKILSWKEKTEDERLRTEDRGRRTEDRKRRTDNGQQRTEDKEEMVKMTIPIRDRRANSSLALDVHIKAKDSLESAGRRVRLFNRLIDEFNISKLPRQAAAEVICQA